MILLLFLLFISLPIIEIMVIVQAGGAIGWINVILLTILTAVIGTFIIRQQGFTALSRMRQSMDEGEPPVAPVVDGIFLLIAAPLLMTPGFVTDGFGFLLLIPQVRYFLGRIALRKLQEKMDKGQVTIIRH